MDNSAANNTLPPWMNLDADGVILRVYAQPGAKKDEVTGLFADRLKIRIQSPPQGGQANKSLCRFVAGLTNSPKSRILLLRGAKSRQKDLLLQGVSPQQVLRSLSY